MHIKTLAGLAAALLFSAPVMASDDASGRYAGAASFNWQIAGDADTEGSGVRFAVGQALNQYLSVEAQLATGGGKDGLRLKRQLGAYLRADWPLTETLRVHARYGYAETKLEVVGAAGPGGVVLADISDRGGSYGAGIDVRVLPGVLDGRLSFTADYMVFHEGRGTKVDARSIGLRLDLR